MMINDSTKPRMLFGKAVLLIGNDTVVLQNLVMQLAKKGADIALLCWRLPLDVARKMKEYVQAFGQRLVLIERAENQRFSVEQLIHSVINKWGHFDIFIDISAGSGTKDKTETQDLQTAWLPSKWQLTRTVIEEIAHT